LAQLNELLVLGKTNFLSDVNINGFLVGEAIMSNG
jgi:hypothetical protein